MRQVVSSATTGFQRGLGLPADDHAADERHPVDHRAHRAGGRSHLAELTGLATRALGYLDKRDLIQKCGAEKLKEMRS